MFCINVCIYYQLILLNYYLATQYYLIINKKTILHIYLNPLYINLYLFFRFNQLAIFDKLFLDKNINLLPIIKLLLLHYCISNTSISNNKMYT